MTQIRAATCCPPEPPAQVFRSTRSRSAFSAPIICLLVQSVFMAGTTLTDSSSKNLLNSTTYDASLGMTKILNRHTVKFGYEHRRYYDNFYNSASSEFRFQSTRPITSPSTIVETTRALPMASDPRCSESMTAPSPPAPIREP